MKFRGYWTGEGDLKVFEFWCAGGKHHSRYPDEISGCCGELRVRPSFPVVRYKGEEFEIRNGMPVRIRENIRDRHSVTVDRVYSQPALF